MKTIIALLFTLFSINAASQTLDLTIGTIADDLAKKAFNKNRIRLALTDFVNSEGKVDPLTDYIREELELKLINADNLQVIDRKHIQLLLSENKLQSDGLIDEKTAKSAVSFIKVDGWVIAEITHIGEQIKIKIKIIDVTTSQIFAASTSGLINDNAIKELLDKTCDECGGKGTIAIQSTCKICDGKGSYMCTSCKGAGRRNGTFVGDYITCEGCNGAGNINCRVCSGKGKTTSYKTCPKCNGRVQNVSNVSASDAIEISEAKFGICTRCNGMGKFTEERTCPTCYGTKSLVIRGNLVPCTKCNGKGSLTTSNNCNGCNGTGKIPLGN